MKYKSAIGGALLILIIGMPGILYNKKHPDINNVKSIQSSWLSEEEKLSYTERVVRLACDQRFRMAFKPGVSVVSTQEVEHMTEQTEAYQYLNNVAILYGDEAYQGSYICSYSKDNGNVVVNVNMESGVTKLLK